MTKAAIIKVYGKVQGVGFRFYTNKKAVELGILGYVQNKPDGSVYIEAQGDEIDLLTFIDWCNIGPQWARVSNVESQFFPPINYDGFYIK
ncbi:MAG: acylphosphatase [Bacteroidetes bacterium]|nr:acylphosphatase [Bacteroidota bacterium]